MKMKNSQQPLLSSEYTNDSPVIGFKFIGDHEGDNDIRPMINGVKDFSWELFVESKKLWNLAAPAIFTSVCTYTIGALTQIFAGQLGTLQLAAISVENSVIAGFSYGIMFGLGSALETLCGQAYGAGQLEMLGINMQKSWIILNTVALGLMFTYIFGISVLNLLGQTAAISKAAGNFAIWMIPQLFAYATIIPTIKFLQAQSKVMVMAVITLVALLGHIFFSWLLIVKLGWGMVGAALALDGSWWFMTVAQVCYILCGSCGKAWTGLSWKAFHNLWGFVGLSFASAIMICLEIWYSLALVLFAGFFENAEISVDALSICINILGWTMTVALGFNVAISVRVSNELGLGRPRAAKFSVIVLLFTALLVSSFFVLVLIFTRKEYATFFTSNVQVKQLVEDLTPLLAVSIIVTSAQNVLCGVAIGAGWQSAVAYLNLGCYFMFGVPISYIAGFKFNIGVRGIWYGMLAGVSLQCCLLLALVCRANWKAEADAACDRIKLWGGETSLCDNEEIGAKTRSCASTSL